MVCSMAPTREAVDYFKKRVPEDFYETEEELGELPEGWEKGFKGSQVYFVDHSTKTTTWIDPRTAKTREKDINKIKEGELPYGWDEALDDEIGVYYIDHNTQTTYLDPPWDENIRYQVSQLYKFIADQQKRIEDMQRRMQQDDVHRMEDASKRVQQLEIRRLELERELLELRNQALSRSSSMSSISEQDILDDISDVDERIRIERLMQGDSASITAEVDKFKARLAELKDMSQRLSATGVDEVAQAKQAQAEMERLQKALNAEAEERHRLEVEIVALKNELYSAIGDNRRARIVPTVVKDEDVPRPRMTKYEMEMELLMLKKRLIAEQEEKERLSSMKDQMEGARRTAAGLLPDWIRQLEDVASNSRTLRVKIGRKQADNPDKLTFRERMLFFASGAVESNVRGPPTPLRKPGSTSPPS